MWTFVEMNIESTIPRGDIWEEDDVESRCLFYISHGRNLKEKSVHKHQSKSSPCKKAIPMRLQAGEVLLSFLSSQTRPSDSPIPSFIPLLFTTSLLSRNLKSLSPLGQYFPTKAATKTNPTPANGVHWPTNCISSLWRSVQMIHSTDIKKLTKKNGMYFFPYKMICRIRKSSASSVKLWSGERREICEEAELWPWILKTRIMTVKKMVNGTQTHVITLRRYIPQNRGLRSSKNSMTCRSLVWRRKSVLPRQGRYNLDSRSWNP